MSSRMNIGRRRKFREQWLNKVKWGIDDKTHTLLPIPYKNRIVPMVTEKDLDDFQERCDEIIETEMKTHAPKYLQFGGHVIALLVAILGAIALTEASAAVGSVLFILGFLLFILAFWYRDQLISKGWKRIGQEFQNYFKEFGQKTPGVAYEFHVQGKHREADGSKRATVQYQRYIVIYLPGDQHHYHKYVADKRSVGEILHADSKPQDTFKPEIDGEAVTLPYWWATAQDQTGKTYYINNLKHRTQWTPPSLEQIEMERSELAAILDPPEDESEEPSQGDLEEDSSERI